MQRRTDKPINAIHQQRNQRAGENTYQLHYAPYCALYVHGMIAIYSYQARAASDGWKLNKSSVVRHDRSEVVGAIYYHPIKLAGNDDRLA